MRCCLASRCPRQPASVRRMRRQKRQNRLVELARSHLREGMPAAREDFDLSAGYQAGQLLGEIGGRHEVVLGTHYQGRRLDLAETLGAIEGENRVDPAGGHLGGREYREVLRLELAQALIVAGDPPARIEVKRVRL